MDLKYRKEYGSYYLYDKENLIFMSDEISVLYDSEVMVMLKHGRPDSVQKVYDNYKSKGLSKSLEIVTSNKWNVDELNKILSTSGYIQHLDNDLHNPLAKSRFLE